MGLGDAWHVMRPMRQNIIQIPSPHAIAVLPFHGRPNSDAASPPDSPNPTHLPAVDEIDDAVRRRVNVIVDEAARDEVVNSDRWSYVQNLLGGVARSKFDEEIFVGALKVVKVHGEAAQYERACVAVVRALPLGSVVERECLHVAVRPLQ